MGACGTDTPSFGPGGLMGVKQGLGVELKTTLSRNPLTLNPTPHAPVFCRSEHSALNRASARSAPRTLTSSGVGCAGHRVQVTAAPQDGGGAGIRRREREPSPATRACESPNTRTLLSCLNRDCITRGAFESFLLLGVSFSNGGAPGNRCGRNMRAFTVAHSAWTSRTGVRC
jgi:hypothetical protein